MRILDPIHKHIFFSDCESDVINSVVFQRLRYIRQLGFAEFAFPGAVHNRFLHSLGVCHLAGRAFDSLFSNDIIPLPPDKKIMFRKIVRLAGLLHDVGHGPLSHICEPAMPLLADLQIPFYEHDKNDHQKQAVHEHYTIKFLLESDLKEKILAMKVEPLAVAHLIDHRVLLPDNNFFVVNGVDFKPVLRQIISSDLDVDRMDYLQRDSFFCGIDYGFCDHEWILNNLHLYIKDDRAFLAIGQKAAYSVESVLLGRRHMGLVVYFHNKMVAMEEMLYQYFHSLDRPFQLPLSLDEYLSFTDGALFENLKLNVNQNEWARRIVNNQPYEQFHEIRYPYCNQKKTIKKIQNIKDFLQEQKVHFIHTNSLMHIKKLYNVQGVNNGSPVSILDESTNEVVCLQEQMRVFSQPEDIQLIDRIYVSPENKIKLENKEN